jgi:hypothetical protein
MQAERELRQYVDAVMAALALEGGIPTLTAGEPVEPPAGREGHFQITLDNELWLGDGEPFPEAAAGWARYERHLGRGYLLEVALERTLNERRGATRHPAVFRAPLGPARQRRTQPDGALF